MNSMTGGVMTCIAWLGAWWGRYKARDVLRQYAVIQENAPEALADLLRFCLVFDTTIDEQSPRRTDYNQGRREVGLYITQMLQLTDADLRVLENKTQATETTDA